MKSILCFSALVVVMLSGQAQDSYSVNVDNLVLADLFDTSDDYSNVIIINNSVAVDYYASPALASYTEAISAEYDGYYKPVDRLVTTPYNEYTLALYQPPAIRTKTPSIACNNYVIRQVTRRYNNSIGQESNFLQEYNRMIVQRE